MTGFPGIFAAGDILDWKEVKQVAKYGNHVKILASNILSYLNGQPLTAQYKSMFEGIFITNGVVSAISDSLISIAPPCNFSNRMVEAHTWTSCGAFVSGTGSQRLSKAGTFSSPARGKVWDTSELLGTTSNLSSFVGCSVS